MRHTFLVRTMSALALALPLAGMDSTTVGPRALGMGGAGTAAADDTAAQFYNPAIYGFFGREDADGKRLGCDPNDLGRKDWGVGVVDASAGYEARGRLADYVQQLDGVDLSRMASLGTSAPQSGDLKAAMLGLGLIENFTPSRDFVVANANAGAMGIRIGRVGIGFRVYTQALLSMADLDFTNVGIGASQATLVGNIDAITPSGWTAGYTPSVITAGTPAYAALLAANSGVNDANFQDAVSRLDYAGHQAGLSDQEIANMVAAGGTLTNAILNTGTANTFDKNTTASFAAGYALAELPVTIGWPVRDWLAVGGSAKLLVGRLAAAKVRLESNNDSLASYLKDAVKNGDRTVTFGLDLGVQARGSWWQAGLAVRNLNRPVLKGGTFTDADGQPFELDDVALDPQVALGVAAYPWTTFCVTGDLDLTENRTRYATTSQRSDLAPGTDPTLAVEYKSRKVRLGAEWNIRHTLALRGGYSKDLADASVPTMVHGGVGLNLWAVRLDLAGAISTEKVTVDGSEVPRSAELSAGLAVDF